MFNHTTLTKIALCAGLFIPVALSGAAPAHAEKRGYTTYVYKDGRKEAANKKIGRGLQGYDKLDLSGINKNSLPKNSVSVPDIKEGSLDWEVR